MFHKKNRRPVLKQQLLDAGVASEQQFSVDPRPIDKNVPANFLQNLVFKVWDGVQHADISLKYGKA